MRVLDISILFSLYHKNKNSHSLSTLKSLINGGCSGLRVALIAALFSNSVFAENINTAPIADDVIALITEEWVDENIDLSPYILQQRLRGIESLLLQIAAAKEDNVVTSKIMLLRGEIQELKTLKKEIVQLIGKNTKRLDTSDDYAKNVERRFRKVIKVLKNVVKSKSSNNEDRISKAVALLRKFTSSNDSAQQQATNKEIPEPTFILSEPVKRKDSSKKAGPPAYAVSPRPAFNMYASLGEIQLSAPPTTPAGALVGCGYKIVQT